MPFGPYQVQRAWDAGACSDGYLTEPVDVGDKYTVNYLLDITYDAGNNTYNFGSRPA